MNSVKKSPKRLISICLTFFIVFSTILTSSGLSSFGYVGQTSTYTTGESRDAFGSLLDKYSRFIVVRHKQLGGSHYAYTDLLSDERETVHNNESYDNFNESARGAQMILLELYENPFTKKIERKETVLLETSTGIIRDPDVSEDGKRVVYSYKSHFNDDCHLYEMDLTTKEIKQLTFGSGVSDVEPKYLPNGKIVFSSTRAIQTVDCWVTPVMNMYICDADGSNIMRVGYDQVHTTYPTVTEDGRILYTRWDYNDRNQMFVQPIFQMNIDGTNQTEVFGNNSNFPTTLLHTRDVPGSPGVYVTIASGHHNHQVGKLALIDTRKGRNNTTNDGEYTEAFQYVFDHPGNLSRYSWNVDTGNADSAPVYKYPIALNENEFLVSFYNGHYHGRNTPFGIYYMNSKTNKRILICGASSTYGGASQIVPISTRTLFERPSTVDYSVNTGTFYIGNIYEGDGLKGVPVGTAKYLRVVEIEYRTAAIGATISQGTGSADPFTPVSTGNGSWDVKRVLGIVDIEEDGSCMFEVPADTPVYFQVLNADGEMIQSMRSWSTLMPNETFSCVGCHEDKNTVPPLQSKTTIAMKKAVQNGGPQKLKPDLWMDNDPETYDAERDSDGFSYLKEVQPIFDKNCVSCHNNVDLAEELIGTAVSSGDDKGITPDATALLPLRSSFKYRISRPSGDWTSENYNDSSWSTGYAPFGTPGTPPGDSIGTRWDNDQLYLRKKINVPSSIVNNKNDYDFYIRITYDESPTLYLNGVEIYKRSGWTTQYVDQKLPSSFRKNLKAGTNTIALSASQTGGGQLINFGIYAVPNKGAGYDTDNQISLQSTLIPGDREKMYYPLSYLVLTGSTLRGNQFVGDSENIYTNWISSMSQCEMLDPYQYGSTKSNLIKRLKNDNSHKNLLTKKEIQTIAAWIDLAVPLRGSYDELKRWNANEYKEFEAKENKRNMFDTIDRVTKRIVTGTCETDNKEIKIEYLDGSKVVKSQKGKGMVRLTLDSPYKGGNKVRITLPEGEKYLFFNLHERLAEALIYCPEGYFEYTIPSKSLSDKIFPSFIMSSSTINPTMTARIACEEELKERRNLAVNPYAITAETSKTFPHAVGTQTYNTSGEFDARNAIDGFKNNLGHGTFPVQSWGPVQRPSSDMYFKIDFGTPVYVDSVGITIRADFPHDTYYKSATLVFSDNTTQKVTLTKTDQIQFVKLNNVKKTSSIIIKDLVTAEPTWAALTEVEVFGSVLPPSSFEDIPMTGINLPSSMKIKVEDSEKLSVTYIPSNTTDDRTVIWSSSNTSVATVDANGNVKGIKPGTATITAKVGNFQKSCNVTVDPIPLTGISLPSTLSLNVGSSKKLTVTYIPSNTTDDRTVTWSSSNTSIATVDANGNVKGIKPGTATITAKVGSFQKSCTVTVAEAKQVPSKLTSSKYTINNSTSYISKITLDTKVSDFLKGINEREYVKVVDKSNKEVSSSTKLGTGMKVRIMDGNTVKKTYTIVVTGDVNGDAKIDLTDFIQVKAYTLKLRSLSGAYHKAADTNGDEKVDLTDFLQIKRHTLGSGKIVAR